MLSVPYFGIVALIFRVDVIEAIDYELVGTKKRLQSDQLCSAVTRRTKPRLSNEEEETEIEDLSLLPPSETHRDALRYSSFSEIDVRCLNQRDLKYIRECYIKELISFA